LDSATGQLIPHASQNPSGIPRRTIVEGEIVACGINCPVAKAKWAESQSNCDAWACVTLLSKKSCALTNGYSFWSSGERSILTIVVSELWFDKIFS